jgi:hypothetical protein
LRVLRKSEKQGGERERERESERERELLLLPPHS